ncbi:MAG: ABC transporter ATP-binding protein [Planctomycetota bacterium]|nr:MAG: ABC transporter ATP-binding protein [Planctomycetota bacterium]REK24339.1 MAG: ABC transporter ATP-binding protein [Planctomycetota bacterium]REK38530.1 MAG: ABC transporter ATP-binding protein [Planctomycetota bacterium]
MSTDWFDDDQEQAVDLQLWKKLLRYTLHYRKTAILFCFVALGLACSDLSFPLLTGRLISDIERDPGGVDLWWYAWCYAGLTLSLCCCIWGFINCAGKIRTHVSHDIRRDAFENLQALSFSFYDKKPVGWLMARLTSDCNRLSNILAWGVMDMIWGSTLMTGVALVMVIYDWKLAFAVLAVVPVLFVISVFFRKRILRASRLVRKLNSRITGTYNEGIVGVRTTKVFVRQRQNLAEFDKLADEMYHHSVHNAVLSAIYLPLVLTVASIAIATALVVGGHQVLAGALTAGEVIMFMYYAELFFHPVQEISAWFAELQMAQASAERVLSLVEAVPEVRDTDAVVRRLEETGSDGHPDQIGRIEFDSVGFRYGTGPQIINDFQLSVEPGQTVALVGATGGGKSTLVNLLCRFYEPTDGRILIDGIDYTDRSLAWLQSNLGIVLQQPHLFSGTIGDNIRYGRLDATQEEIVAAAELAGAHGFIMELEDAYDTQVGEGGSQLSLGERQLVSFARAVLKQPRLLVMDEATSSIDTETERRIQQGLTRVLGGRTSFVIAHRLSTIRAADQIVVIEKGRIAEQGTHTDLLRERGHYYQLYTEQSMRDIVKIDSSFGET